MEGKPGDLLLFAADKNKIVWNVLGALRLELAKELDLLDQEPVQFPLGNRVSAARVVR